MKISVEFSDSEMREIRNASGEKKKGPAIRKIVTDALRLRRRREMVQKFVSGEWAVDLDSWQVTRERERRTARKTVDMWSK
jgi:hypothetical protein